MNKFNYLRLKKFDLIIFIISIDYIDEYVLLSLKKLKNFLDNELQLQLNFSIQDFNVFQSRFLKIDDFFMVNFHKKLPSHFPYIHETFKYLYILKLYFSQFYS